MTWNPRHYQQDAFDARDRGLKRLFLGWHRRAGKDVFALELVRREMERVPGTYWHLFPEQDHARKAIWLGVDNDNVGFIERAFPESERKRTVNHQTMLETDNGWYQMRGSDNYNKLVGSNVRGVVFSEWALCDPKALEYVRPIVLENGGWLLFITTFRGRNHAWKMAQRQKSNPRWYVDIRDVTQTKRHDGTPVVTEEDIQHERDDGMEEEIVRQEFYCDPAAANANAYYGGQIQLAMAA